MTAKVVDIASARRDPHISGPARCLACNHEWIAVAPTGTIYLSCPKCSTERGAWDWPIAASQEYEVFECTVAGCGGRHFKITQHPKDGYEAMCAKCGYSHNAETVFPR